MDTRQQQVRQQQQVQQQQLQEFMDYREQLRQAVEPMKEKYNEPDK